MTFDPLTTTVIDCRCGIRTVGPNPRAKAEKFALAGQHCLLCSSFEVHHRAIPTGHNADLTVESQLNPQTKEVDKVAGCLPESWLPESWLPESWLPPSWLPASWLPASWLPGSWLQASLLPTIGCQQHWLPVTF